MTELEIDFYEGLLDEVLPKVRRTIMRTLRSENSNPEALGQQALKDAFDCAKTALERRDVVSMANGAICFVKALVLGRYYPTYDQLMGDLDHGGSIGSKELQQACGGQALQVANALAALDERSTIGGHLASTQLVEDVGTPF